MACNHRTLEAGILHAPTVLCKQDALPAHRCWQQLHSAARAMTCGGAKSHVCQQRLLPRHPPVPRAPPPSSIPKGSRRKRSVRQASDGRRVTTPRAGVPRQTRPACADAGKASLISSRKGLLVVCLHPSIRQPSKGGDVASQPDPHTSPSGCL